MKDPIITVQFYDLYKFFKYSGTCWAKKKALLSVLVVLLTIPLLPSSVNPADSSLLKDREGKKKSNDQAQAFFSHRTPSLRDQTVLFSNVY